MPTVRYTADGGSYLDADGDRAGPDDPILEVTDEKAEELVEQFGFEYVGGGESTNTPLGATPEDMIDRGECPWCSDYDGDHIGQHASAAHPDEWSTYTEG